MAAYFYDTVEFYRHWELTGGVRVEHYNVGLNSKTAAGAPRVLRRLRGRRDDLRRQDRTGLQACREGSLYASYGISALPPGSLLSNPDISRTGDNTSDNSFPGFVAGCRSREMYNYELGVKWDFFGGKLSTTGALFRTEKQNVASPACSHTASLRRAVGARHRIGHRRESDRSTGRYSAAAAGSKANARHSRVSIGIRRIRNRATTPRGRSHCAGRHRRRRVGLHARLLRNALDHVRRDRRTSPSAAACSMSAIPGSAAPTMRCASFRTAFGKLPDYFLVNAMASYDLTENVDLQPQRRQRLR